LEKLVDISWYALRDRNNFQWLERVEPLMLKPFCYEASSTGLAGEEHIEC